MKKNKSKDKDEEANLVKILAEKNIQSSLLRAWVTEVFEPDPTKKDYDEALSFVEGIIKHAQKEPNYLRLLSKLALLIDESKLSAKLLPFIFQTVVRPYGSSKSKIANADSLELDHKLIMQELLDTAKELRQLKQKARK